MKIQYLGHSAFRLISALGTTIVCDPFDATLTGYDMARVRCDVATISHHHADHDAEHMLLGDPSVLDCPVSCLCDDVEISTFSCNHDDCGGKKRGKNLIFRFTIDGIKAAHMGDVGEYTEQIVSALAGTDVLMIPVGGNYTIDWHIAKKYVDAVDPAVVLPMHYAVAEGKIDIEGVDKFLSLLDPSEIVRSAHDTLVLEDIPSKPRRVVVLSRYVD